jgi:VWFA-related protein
MLCVTAAFSAPPRVSEKTVVVSVQVPVQVVQDGKPVRGLTQDRFELYDGRELQRIDGFEVVDLVSGDPLAAASEVPAAARRYFLILFDLSFSDSSSTVAAQRAARDAILSRLHPTDLVAVGYYSANRGPKLALGFTSDRNQARIAIQTLGLTENDALSKDPLGITIRDPNQIGVYEALTQPEDLVLKPQRTFDTTLTESMRDALRGSETLNRGNRTGQITSFTKDLTALAKLMAGIEGRKYMIYFSEGFDSSLLYGTSDPTETMQLNEALADGDLSKVEADQRSGSYAAQSNLAAMVEEFRRADCVIHAVNLRDNRPDGAFIGRPSGSDSLVYLSDETGGTAIRGTGNLATAVTRMLERTGYTYFLSFSPSDLEIDGKYHKLTVKLKDAPRGVSVVARPGYYAPKPVPERTEQERRLQVASVILGGKEGGRIPTSVLAISLGTAEHRSYVPVLVEVDGAALVQDRKSGPLAVEVYAYAVGENGNIGDYFSQKLSLDLDKVGEAVRSRGLKYYGHLILEPGKYSLRVLVLNGQTGLSGLRVVPLEVRAPDAPGPIVLSPLFPEPTGKWVMVRETPRPSRRTRDEYPFLLKGEPFVPAALPTLAPTGESRVCLIVYKLGPSAPELVARLLRADGVVAGSAKLESLERLPTNVAGEERILATLRVSELMRGEYTLEVTVKDHETGRQASSTVQFRVADELGADRAPGPPSDGVPDPS